MSAVWRGMSAEPSHRGVAVAEEGWRGEEKKEARRGGGAGSRRT